MFKRRNKGFTLIELLVVIAIIGILSAVVLAALNSARKKGEDAGVKANLANIRVQAELVYDDSGNSYANVCTNTTIQNALGAVDSSDCDADTSTWAASAPLPSTSGVWWCVDYTGFGGSTTATHSQVTPFVCP